MGYCGVCTFASEFLVHTAHCDQLHDNSIGMEGSRVNSNGIIVQDSTIPSWNHVSDRSVQCAIETKTLKRLYLCVWCVALKLECSPLWVYLHFTDLPEWNPNRPRRPLDHRQRLRATLNWWPLSKLWNLSLRSCARSTAETSTSWWLTSIKRGRKSAPWKLMWIDWRSEVLGRIRIELHYFIVCLLVASTLVYIKMLVWCVLDWTCKDRRAGFQCTTN